MEIQPFGKEDPAALGRDELRQMLATIEDDLDLGDSGRISLHSLNADDRTFEVVESRGVDLFASGTVLPIETATQIMIPARGDIFSLDSLDSDPSFDHELDRLMKHLGFRSSCSFPLMLGRGPTGVLCVSSRDVPIGVAEATMCMETFGPRLTLSLHAAEPGPAPVALVCYQDVILSEWVGVVLGERFGFTTAGFDSEDAALSFAESHVDDLGLVVCESFFTGGRLRDFITNLRLSRANAPVLVVASSDSSLSLEFARRSGADAYVARKDGLAGLTNAVVALQAGLPLPRLSDRGEGAGARQLTRQECHLLLHLEEGKTFAQTARDMTISVATAKGYARNLFSKFDTHSRAETVFEARRQGVIDFLRGGGSTAFVVARPGR